MRDKGRFFILQLSKMSVTLSFVNINEVTLKLTPIDGNTRFNIELQLPSKDVESFVFFGFIDTEHDNMGAMTCDFSNTDAPVCEQQFSSNEPTKRSDGSEIKKGMDRLMIKCKRD
jgi:hypothetical protein